MIDQHLTALFVEQYGPMVRLASLLVDEVGAAEEVVQEAFVRIFERWDRIANPDAAAGYLRVTCLNLCRSRLRHRAVKRRTLFSTLPLPASEDPSAEDAALDRGAMGPAATALQALPRRQRECLLLRYYLDLSEAEVAATLGISNGAVKSHTSRGIARISAHVANQEAT